MGTFLEINKERTPGAGRITGLSVRYGRLTAMATNRSPRSGKPQYRCAECGWTTPRWVGRCGECQAWGTLDQAGGVRGHTTAARTVAEPARRIGEVDPDAARTQATGIDELDRVLGGGLVPGVVVLLAGEPGVGKSTLLLEAAARWARGGESTLYVSGEESAAQIRLRAGRTNGVADQLYLAAETDLGAVLGHIDDVKPSLLVLDSVQTVASADVDGMAGGVTQVREVAATLMRVAKERGMATVLVGHVTKDGSIAGPRLLEHLVDVVLQFDGDRHSRLRLVRAVKNRYGPSDEVGCFDLSDTGIVSLPDPSGLFLSRHAEPVAGTCVTVTVEGHRPLLAELQSLVAKTNLGTARRATSGVDSARVAMILAVLERRGGVILGDCDVYTATVGGVRLGEPAADLAVSLAVASAATDRPLPPDLVAVGEVGLAGELRRVTGVQRRLAEAARLGFRRALVPADPGPVPDGMAVREVSDLVSALRVLHLITDN
jgi:DNA repair protein RadA/Sms